MVEFFKVAMKLLELFVLLGQKPAVVRSGHLNIVEGGIVDGTLLLGEDVDNNV